MTPETKEWAWTKLGVDYKGIRASQEEPDDPTTLTNALKVAEACGFRLKHAEQLLNGNYYYDFRNANADCVEALANDLDTLGEKIIEAIYNSERE